MALLLGMWDAGIEITEDLVKNTSSLESKISNFFLKARDVERNQQSAIINGVSGADAQDQPLLEALENAKSAVETSLADSFNTPSAMQAISNLITEFNAADKVSPSTTLEIARYVTRMVRIFGLDTENALESERIGWSGIVSSSSSKSSCGTNKH
jgi:cysteinyl-tRNA synthetase